jgi:hypothetical protein
MRKVRRGSYINHDHHIVSSATSLLAHWQPKRALDFRLMLKPSTPPISNP